MNQDQTQPQPTYFKVGQKVYSHLFSSGEGVVVNISKWGEYSVLVEHDRNKNTLFTYDGRYFLDGGIVLSSTPLTLIKNEPIHKFKKGELVWVRDSMYCFWEARYFSHEDNGVLYAFDAQKKSGGLNSWKYCVPFHPTPF